MKALVKVLLITAVVLLASLIAAAAESQDVSYRSGDETVHALGTDPTSMAFLSGGVIYPCQAIFLGPTVHSWSRGEWMNADRLALGAPSATTQFLVFEDGGLLVDDQITPSAEATLSGLAQVLVRVEQAACLRFLTNTEVHKLLTEDNYRYRELVENSSFVAS